MTDRRHLVALVHPDLDRVLLVDGALPQAADSWPQHGDLTATVGDPDAFLATAPSRQPDGVVVDVLLGSGAARPDGRWCGLDHLGPGLTPEVAGVVRAAAGDLRDAPPDDGRAPWWRPGWRGEVDVWVDEVLADRGWDRAGPTRPVKIWSLSAVLRVPVRRSAGAADLWFKAACDGFAAEPVLTEALARLQPDLLPVVVAVAPARAWMLMETVPGADDDDVTELPDLLRAHARLQLDTVAVRDDLVAVGLPDRGLDDTMAWLREVVAHTVELDAMDADLRRAAVEAEPWLADRVRELWSLGLPDAVVHGDLHLGNVATGAGHAVVFDWTDACLSHPYLDAEHLVRSVAALVPGTTTKPLWEAYLEAWVAAHPDVDHARARELVPLVDRVFTMISYEQIYRAQPASSRWELAGVLTSLLQWLVDAWRAAER